LTLPDIENLAQLTRVTCGWKKPHLPLDWVRRYWRDVHSPAIARRAGVYDYRHFQFASVRTGLLTNLGSVSQSSPEGVQLMWLSDVRYRDEAALAEFSRSPDGIVKTQLLADIELIVDRSTTYRAVGQDAWTFVDTTGIAMPQGPVAMPTFGLFFRQRGDTAGFRQCLDVLAAHWSSAAGVRRLRLTHFEAPDMEAERKAGYPIKTHPPEQQYQAWIDLSVDSEAELGALLAPSMTDMIERQVREIHCYPVDVIYTSVYSGRPTLVGLRGYPAYEALVALGGDNQRQPELLEWLYGPIARGGTAENQPP
jgi:hypothetical protein